jgi:1-acyl-sn-glycerol-3-phosphate acyltransferase
MTLIPALRREKLSFVTKKSNYKIPLFTKFMKGLNFLPIDRADHLQSLEMFKRGTELIQQGISSVCVYPEGTRQLDEILGPFHEGVFNIAMHARCPIVIATAKGPEQVHKNFFRRPTKVRIDILGVYQYDDYRSMTAKALSDKIHKIMYQHLDRIDILEYHNKDNEQSN